VRGAGGTNMKMNSFSSSYGQLTIHVSFIVKYRHKIFGFEEIKKLCEAQFRATAQCYGIEIKEIGFDVDHVHLLVSLNPKTSIADVARLLKGASAKKLFEIFPFLRKKYFWCGHLWSPAYYFDSVGRNTYEVMEQYVRCQ